LALGAAGWENFIGSYPRSGRQPSYTTLPTRVAASPRNGREAVERFRDAKPDLIVIDFQMPEMNGLDAARHIVNLSPKTPILMVTIHLSRQLSEEARKVGIRGACAKGNINCVVDAVGALLRQETYFPN
jgi:DNA-binding NarL/FixJ family response regulator